MEELLDNAAFYDFTIESKEVPTSKQSSWEPVCSESKKVLNAAKDGDLNLLLKLLQQQNGTFVTDCLGTSPLHLAAQFNHLHICQLLLQKGFSVDLRNKLEKTPLHLAACAGNSEIVELFIKFGAYLDCQDMLDMTALHWAVQNRHKAVVELLLKGGAVTGLKNKFGLIPHDIAVQVEHEEIIKLLQAYNAESYTAIKALVMQLQPEDENLQELEAVIVDHEINENDPELVDEDFNLIEKESRIENQKNINTEPEIINLCENTEEYSQDTQNEDPVIINLDDIDEELPPITEKNNKFTNFNIVNGVLQPSEEDSNNKFSAVQLLQRHGITMIQNDNEENSILNAAMESGHSVVLTEIGKQVLKTVKQKQAKHVESIDRTNRIITVTPQQFLEIKNNNKILKKIINPNQLNGIRQTGILKKNRASPFIIKNQSIQKPIKPKTEVQILTEKLDKAYQTIAEYKLQLKKSQQEVERYKLQLHSFT